jgi:Holliday junction resolvase RusA-like endonuclease
MAEMLILRSFIIEGAIYPFVHTTRKQKWVDPRYTEKYVPSQDNIRWQLKQQMATRRWDILDSQPFRMTVMFMVSKALHRTDLSNLTKAIEDAMQGIVFPNDAWIDVSFQARGLGPRDVTFIELTNMFEEDRANPMQYECRLLTRLADLIRDAERQH